MKQKQINIQIEISKYDEVIYKNHKKAARKKVYDVKARNKIKTI